MTIIELMFDREPLSCVDADPVPDPFDVPTDWRTGFLEATSDAERPRYSPAQAQPSGWLALEVDAATGDGGVSLDDTDLVDAVIALDRLAGWAAARQARLLAEFARRRPGDDPELVGSDRASSLSRYAPDEVALALSQSRMSAAARLGRSVQLVSVLPAALETWEAGRIDEGKVRAICDATHHLDPETAVAVQDRVLPRASGRSLAQVKAALRRAVIAADPQGANERHKKARLDRRVVVGDETDGMASLWALLPAHAASASYQWLTRLARGLGAEDPRGMDARRADLMTDLLTGNLTITAEHPAATVVTDVTATGATATGATATATSAPGASAPETAAPETAAGGRAAGAQLLRPVGPGKPLVQVVMPHSTLLGRDDQPCELVGFGPIPADLAREIAADAVWTRLVTDPLSGALLDHGRTTYRPPAALADFVRARDTVCRMPICRRRAADAELDHTVPFPDGPTAASNLYAGCTHDHHLKHDARWTVTQHCDGRITWTTPTGHPYTSEPWDHGPEPEPPRRPVRDPNVVPVPTTPTRLNEASLWATPVDPPDDDDPPPF